MKTVVFLNEKGGCGKTTTATHIAAGLSLRGNRVLLVDTDPQAHTTIAVGLQKRPHFHDLAAREAPWRDVVQMVHPDVYSPKNEQAKGALYCVAGNHESFTTAAHLPRQSIIRERFAEMDGRIDYIIVDTSPTPSTLHEAIAVASDYILIPTECEYFSALDGLPNSKMHVDRVHAAGAKRGFDVAKVIGILPNKYDARSVLHVEVLADLQAEYGDLVWEPLPFSKTVGQAQMKNQFLYAMYPRHAITRKIWDVVNRLEAVCQNA